MRYFPRFALSSVLLISAIPVPQGRAQGDEYQIFTDSPRLLLPANRLRLLQRERERKSARWLQFDTLVTGGAPMPEPGFAYCLYYRVSGQAAWAKQALDWALSDKATPRQPETLRQLALVYDWCGQAATEDQMNRLSQKIRLGITGASATDVKTQSARALAVIAVADEFPDHGESLLKPMVEKWWRQDIITKIKAGQPAIAREHTYALLEFLHAIRDNLKIDLRQDASDFFKGLPTDHLVSHYPAPVLTPDNEYRIPVYVRNGEPSVADAVLSRAAEFAMVAYDSNAAENQFLQGWLMQNRFLMRGALGAVYEFLWANPYQPGLSYFQVPLVYHDGTTGHLFARTSWDEDASWLGYFNGTLQIFRDGSVQTLRQGVVADPVRVGDALILTGTNPQAGRFRADAPSVFITGLARKAVYDVEIDDQELSEESTDVGGTMVLQFPEGLTADVRIKRRAE